jgi:hypothetical protein
MIHKPTEIGPYLQVVDGNLCETCSVSINYQDITHPDNQGKTTKKRKFFKQNVFVNIKCKIFSL